MRSEDWRSAEVGAGGYGSGGVGTAADRAAADSTLCVADGADVPGMGVAAGGFCAATGAGGGDGEDIKGFLSELAVKGRVSKSTQKQALNALVFLFREGLGREAGDLKGFQMSRRGPREIGRASC